MQEQAFEKRLVKGYDMHFDASVKDDDLKNIIPNATYIQRTGVIAVPVNHARRMKKLSREFGMKGAVSYAMMVQERYQAEQQLQEAAKAPAPPTETEKAP